MTPKEKAQELFSDMYLTRDPLNKYPMCYDTAKACALRSVDEIISLLKWSLHYGYEKQLEYWQQVQFELNYL
jgi:hypothetical protein